MKKIITILFSLALFCSSFAQIDQSDNFFSICDLVQASFEEEALIQQISLKEVPGYKDFHNWKKFYRTRIGENGSISEYMQAMDNYYLSNSDIIGENSLTWSYIGPEGLWPNFMTNPPIYSRNVGQGLIVSLWVNESNPSRILAGGAWSGGVWLTENGGADWLNISENERKIQAVSSFWVNPQNLDEIFLTTYSEPLAYSNGIFYSTYENGIYTWHQNMVFVSGQGNLYPHHHIKFKPVKFIKSNTGKMYLLTTTQLLRSADNGQTWTVIINRLNSPCYDPWSNKRVFGDMELDPANNDILYVTGPEAFRVSELPTDQVDIVDITANLLQNTSEDCAIAIMVDIHPTFPKVYFTVENIDNINKYVVVLFNNNYTPYTNASLNYVDTFRGQLLQCEVNPLDENKVYIGGAIPSGLNLSTNSVMGGTWAYFGVGLHNDNRSALWVKNGTDDVLFLGTDGGLTKVINWPNTSWQYIANDGENGVRNLDIQGFDCSYSVEDIVCIGTSHDGMALRRNNEWYRIFEGGDQQSVLIDPTDPNKIYVTRFATEQLWYSFNMGQNSSNFYSYTNATYVEPPILFFKPNDPNVLYAGEFKQIIKFNTNNIGTNISYPITGDNYDNEQNFREYCTNKNLPNTFFVALDRYFPQWDPNWHEDQNGNHIYPYQNAFFKVNIDNNGAITGFIDLSENIKQGLKGGPITGLTIEAKQDNTFRIWAAFGTTASDEPYAKKIYCSDDLGQTWEPMATDLPVDIPTEDLFFDERSGNVFLTNDVGLYLFDYSTLSWINITGDLPPMISNRLRFSPFDHKIRIGSHGKGLWETEMPCFNDGITLNLQENKTWENVTSLNGDLVIEPEVTLTIRNIVYIPTGKKIVVQRGAKLIIDGGSLTNACDGLWKGIEVWGDPTKSSVVNNQGLVWIKNGGIIENAECGIRAVRMGLPEGEDILLDEPLLDYSGGIVWADGAEFINNQEAVRFYKYPATGYTHQHTSFFWAARFETNDNYLGSIHPDYFVNLSDINKVSFKGCEFNNNTTQQNFQTGGIYSYNSQFYVEGNLTGETWENNLFRNMYYGIYAIASNPNRFADIRHTDFDLNFRGLYISGMTAARVTSNRFIINEPFITTGGYGLYLNTSTGYWVEDNDFEHEGANQNGIGIIVNNSGGDNNEIYRNRFNNLTQGISAQRKNCDINQEPETGLQILCNDFDVCTADILIPQPGLGNGISPYQGYDSSDPEDMAGNLFYWESLTPDNDYDDINNQGVHVTYYFPSNPAPAYPNVEPKDYTHEPPYNTVTIVPVEVDPDWTPENGCPSHIETGGGGSSELREQMAESQQKIDSTESLLAILVDGGNTEAMQEEVEYSIPPEAMAIYSELIDNSPYLSDTVVSTAIEKENVLPGAMIRDVMVANPHTAKSDELMNKLDERWTPLPEYMKEQILQGKNIVSVMEKTESRLTGFMIDKSRAMNALARNYRNDTVAGIDSLTMLYASDNSVESKYRLAFLSMEQGAWSMGMTTLNSIPSQFELNAEQQAEHQNIVQFYNLLASINVSAPDSVKVQELTEIMEQEKGEASMYALNMLIDLREVQYDEPIDLPDFMKSTEATGSFKNINNTAAPRSLKVMPNPAKDYIIVEYELEIAGKAVMEICDVTGKPVHSVQVVNMKDQLTIDTRYWNPGIYIATLKINGKSKETVKFTITD